MASGGIGPRIAHYRRKAGYVNVHALAAAINNPLVTASVLRNIESGRKSDPSTTQLVEIALAVGVPLTFLLAPMETPLEAVDLPHLSRRSASMPASEFDARLSASGSDATWWPASHALAWRHLQALRQVLRDLAMLDDLDAQERAGTALPGERQEALSRTRSQLRFLTDRDTATLAQYQDVAWVPRPWLDDGAEREEAERALRAAGMLPSSDGAAEQTEAQVRTDSRR